MTLILSLLSLVALALAGDPTLIYDLSVDGKRVGERQVTVTYQQTERGEIRLIQSWTEIQVSWAGAPMVWRQRLSAKEGSTPAFTSVVDEAGRPREIQGRMSSDRFWTVTVGDKGTINTYNLRPSEVTLTSVDLIDPVRSRLLVAGPVALLLAETGTVLNGTVQDGGPTTVTVGGQEVSAHRWILRAAEGEQVLTFTDDGVLVAYDTALLGRTLSAKARALPPPPSFGAAPTLQGGGTTLGEEAL